ncbi:hypothetical protein SFC65_19955 [Priestia filamentosa]|uniref:hypothetical protein n=1 Tax=Priestia filamentosa TaxID=1402861 RepID=UPI00398221FF
MYYNILMKFDDGKEWDSIIRASAPAEAIEMAFKRISAESAAIEGQGMALLKSILYKFEKESQVLSFFEDNEELGDIYLSWVKGENLYVSNLDTIKLFYFILVKTVSKIEIEKTKTSIEEEDYTFEEYMEVIVEEKIEYLESPILDKGNVGKVKVNLESEKF